MDHQSQAEEIQAILQSLNQELEHLNIRISREPSREKRELQEDHEAWAPLILDARARLAEGYATVEEIALLEKEENNSRLSIRRKYREIMTDLARRKGDVQSEIERLQASLSPSRKLLTDCLRVAFQIYVEAGGSPWTLAHTCARWRGVVLETPSLWSGICISSNIDHEIIRRYNGKEVCNTLPRLRRALKRVGNAPIDLDIMLNWSHTSLDVRSIKTMIVVISYHACQWRTLHIENSEKVLTGDQTIPFPSSIFDLGFPSLVQVSFHMEHFNINLPSTGLLPFSPLIPVISHSSRKLRCVQFHGYGRNEPVNSNYQKPEHISYLSVLLLPDMRKLRDIYAEYIKNRMDGALVALKYGPFVLGTEQYERLGGRNASHTTLSVNHRITIHSSIPGALFTTSLRNICTLDIFTWSGLNLESTLLIPNVRQVFVCSNDFTGLHHLCLPNLNILQAGLLSKEYSFIEGSRAALQEYLDTRNPQPTNIRLINFGLDYMLLSTMSYRNSRLKRVILENPHLMGDGVLLGLAQTLYPSCGLQEVEVMFEHMLGPTKLGRLSDDLRKLVSTRRSLTEVSLINGREKNTII